MDKNESVGVSDSIPNHRENSHPISGTAESVNSVPDSIW